MKIAAFLTATLIGLSAVAQPKIVAHRGHWRTAGSAQNSIASWHKADSVGVYGAEMDVWMNADGGLVVNHDQTFKGVNASDSGTRGYRSCQNRRCTQILPSARPHRHHCFLNQCMSGI